MQTQYNDEKGVRPSVSPYVPIFICQMSELWQNRRSIQIFILYDRSFSLFFWEDERLVGATPSIWNCWSTDSRWSEIEDFEPIFARSASAETPSEKNLGT